MFSFPFPGIRGGIRSWFQPWHDQLSSSSLNGKLETFPWDVELVSRTGPHLAPRRELSQWVPALSVLCFSGLFFPLQILWIRSAQWDHVAAPESWVSGEGRVGKATQNSTQPSQRGSQRTSLRKGKKETQYNLLSYLCWLPMGKKEQCRGKYNRAAYPTTLHIWLGKRADDCYPPPSTRFTSLVLFA